MQPLEFMARLAALIPPPRCPLLRYHVCDPYALAELKATLAAATREAYADGEWSVVVSAVRAGHELIKTGELEREVAELKDLICERFPELRSRLGRVSP